jgi:enoyl-CoA hydratase/carnithine racemase
VSKKMIEDFGEAWHHAAAARLRRVILTGNQRRR